MLTKHIIGYIPSLIIPALSSFAAVYCYTHLLTPSEYGHYTLAVNFMTLLNAVFFYWLQVSLPRLMPQAIREGRGNELRVTIYLAFGVVSVVLVVCGCLLLKLISVGDLYWVAWLALPLALARA